MTMTSTGSARWLIALAAGAMLGGAAPSAASGQSLNPRLGLAGGVQPGYGWQNKPQWQLGVQVQNTTTGVVLTQVLPGGAAANGGLRVGDRILAAGGHQVGYVDGRLVDLGDEINQHINPRGQVTLLVFNTQLGQVQSGPLTLQSSGGVIQGTAVGSGGPRPSVAAGGAERADAGHQPQSLDRGVVVAQTSVHCGRSPVSFQLAYNPAQVFQGHSYAIEAEVVDQGRDRVPHEYAGCLHPAGRQQYGHAGPHTGGDAIARTGRASGRGAAGRGTRLLSVRSGQRLVSELPGTTADRTGTAELATARAARTVP